MPGTVGIIGLGSIGEPVARHMLDAGYEVAVTDVRDAPVERLVSAGAARATSPSDLSGTCDVVVVLVEDEAQTEAVVVGRGGLADGDHGDLIVVISSTVPPELCTSLAERTDDRIRFVDAPVCRGADAARDGRLLVLVGGDPAVVEQVEPVLASVAHPQDIHHMGGLGLGQVAKTANNFLLWTALVADAEMFDLCREYGVDIDDLTDALSKSSGTNWGINTWTDRYPREIPWAHKDMRIAIDMAERRGKTLPLGGLVRELVRELQDEWSPNTGDR